MAERQLTTRDITFMMLEVLLRGPGEGPAIVVDEDPDARPMYRPSKIGDTIRVRKPPQYSEYTSLPVAS